MYLLLFGVRNIGVSMHTMMKPYIKGKYTHTLPAQVSIYIYTPPCILTTNNNGTVLFLYNYMFSITLAWDIAWDVACANSISSTTYTKMKLSICLDSARTT